MKSSQLKNMKRRVFKIWVGEGAVRGPLFCQSALPEGKVYLLVALRQEVVFQVGARGLPKLGFLLFLGDLEIGVLFPLTFPFPDPQFLEKDSCKGREALRRFVS